MDERDEIGRALKPATLVAAAVVASLIVYLAVVEVLKAAFKPFRGFAAAGDIQPVRYAVFGAGAAVVLLLLVLRPRLFRRRQGEGSGAFLQRLQRSSLLAAVLGEVPATLGLLLFLVGGGARDFYRLLAVSIVLLFIFFPRRGAWEDSLKG